MFDFDIRKLRDSVLQEISLGAKNGLFLPPGSGTPVTFLPGVGTSALPHAALQQVQNALGAMRDDLANHTAKPYSSVDWAIEAEWCNILDPRLFCTAMPHRKRHKKDGPKDAADDFIPTRYTHHGGKGFAREAHINGTQLMPADVVGGFDAAANAFLEAAFPLLAQTPYISETDDGGVAGGPDASPLTLTADGTAEADEFSELLLRRFPAVKILKGPVPVERDEEEEGKTKKKKKKPRGKRARKEEEVAEEPHSIHSRLETLGAAGAGPREDGAFMEELDGLLSSLHYRASQIYEAMSVAMPDAAEEEEEGVGDEEGAGDDGPPCKKQRTADPRSPWDLAHAGSLDALRSTSWVCQNTADYHHREHGTTLLYTAARSGHRDVCEWLLSQGADPNTPCTDAKSRSTPLHAAAYGGHPEVLRLLLDNGADRAAKNAYGDTPLDDAKNTKGTAAAGAMCVKTLNEFVKQARPVTVHPTETPVAHALVSCVEKDPQATPEALRAIVVAKAHELASVSPFLTTVPDPREVVLKRKQMEAYCAGRPRLGGLLQEGLSVVWQASDVRLTPENRVFTGSDALGHWGMEGCAASLLLVVGCDNVTPSVIRVQERVVEGLLPAQPSRVHYPLLCGVEKNISHTRLASEVPLVPGALVSMHREHLHSIAPFQLLDATKPGRLTLLWMMVVDPDRAQAAAPVLTTSEVPDTSAWISPNNALDHARVMLANTQSYSGDFTSQ